MGGSGASGSRGRSRCSPRCRGGGPRAGAGARTSRGGAGTGTRGPNDALPPLTEDARSLIERAAPLEIQTENPKKGASAARFDAYKNSTNAKEFCEKGGTKADLKYDIARGYGSLDRGPPLVHAQARSIRPAQAPPVDGPQSPSVV